MQWFAVYTKPRKETLAEEHLQRQGYEVYSPCLQQLRRYRGRWRKMIAPLFPRYLFVSLMAGRDNFAPIRSTFGVIDLVRFGNVPKAVPQDLIEAIRAHEVQGVRVRCQQWQPGDSVKIIAGPFAGLNGLFGVESAEERVIILLRLLGRDNKVRVARDAVVPA